MQVPCLLSRKILIFLAKSSRTNFTTQNPKRGFIWTLTPRKQSIDSKVRSQLGRGGGVLPYISCIDICRPKGYHWFTKFFCWLSNLSNNDIIGAYARCENGCGILRFLVWNRVRICWTAGGAVPPRIPMIIPPPPPWCFWARSIIYLIMARFRLKVKICKPTFRLYDVRRRFISRKKRRKYLCVADVTNCQPV